MSGTTVPRSRRNNNPLNLTPMSGATWVGQVGVADGYAVFAHEVDGWRAAALNLMAYQDKYSINTLDGITKRWAGLPTAEDPNNPMTLGNNPTAYAKAVSAATGIDVNAPLNLHDPDTLQKVMAAMAVVEDNRVTWNPAGLIAGVLAATSTGAPVLAPSTPLPATQPSSALETVDAAYNIWVARQSSQAEIFAAGWEAALKSRGIT